MRNGAAFCLMFLLLPGVALGQAAPALQLTTRIALPNVDGRMDHMGVDLGASASSRRHSTITPSR